MNDRRMIGYGEHNWRLVSVTYYNNPLPNGQDNDYDRLLQYENILKSGRPGKLKLYVEKTLLRGTNYEVKR